MAERRTPYLLISKRPLRKGRRFKPYAGIAFLKVEGKFYPLRGTFDVIRKAGKRYPIFKTVGYG